MKKKLQLKNTNKKLNLKKKKEENKTEDTTKIHNAILEKNIQLSEERNKELGKPIIGKWYHYKDRLPPDDWDSWVALCNNKDRMDINVSSLALQHYVNDLFCFNRKPIFAKWSLINMP